MIFSLYRHQVLAESLNTGRKNKVFGEALGEMSEFQNNLIETTQNAIIDKDRKSTYERVKSAYGKGILLLYLDDPLAGSEDIDAILNPDNYNKNSLQNFHSVYLYIRPTYSYSGGEMFFRSGIFAIRFDAL